MIRLVCVALLASCARPLEKLPEIAASEIPQISLSPRVAVRGQTVVTIGGTSAEMTALLGTRELVLTDATFVVPEDAPLGLQEVTISARGHAGRARVQLLVIDGAPALERVTTAGGASDAIPGDTLQLAVSAIDPRGPAEHVVFVQTAAGELALPAVSNTAASLSLQLPAEITAEGDSDGTLGGTLRISYAFASAPTVRSNEVTINVLARPVLLAMQPALPLSGERVLLAFKQAPVHLFGSAEAEAPTTCRRLQQQGAFVIEQTALSEVDVCPVARGAALPSGALTLIEATLPLGIVGTQALLVHNRYGATSLPLSIAPGADALAAPLPEEPVVPTNYLTSAHALLPVRWSSNAPPSTAFIRFERRYRKLVFDYAAFTQPTPERQVIAIPGQGELPPLGTSDIVGDDAYLSSGAYGFYRTLFGRVRLDGPAGARQSVLFSNRGSQPRVLLFDDFGRFVRIGTGEWRYVSLAEDTVSSDRVRVNVYDPMTSYEAPVSSVLLPAAVEWSTLSTGFYPYQPLGFDMTLGSVTYPSALYTLFVPTGLAVVTLEPTLSATVHATTLPSDSLDGTPEYGQIYGTTTVEIQGQRAILVSALVSHYCPNGTLRLLLWYLDERSGFDVRFLRLGLPLACYGVGLSAGCDWQIGAPNCVDQAFQPYGHSAALVSGDVLYFRADDLGHSYIFASPIASLSDWFDTPESTLYLPTGGYSPAELLAGDFSRGALTVSPFPENNPSLMSLVPGPNAMVALMSSGLQARATYALANAASGTVEISEYQLTSAKRGLQSGSMSLFSDNDGVDALGINTAAFTQLLTRDAPTTQTVVAGDNDAWTLFVSPGQLAVFINKLDGSGQTTAAQGVVDSAVTTGLSWLANVPLERRALEDSGRLLFATGHELQRYDPVTGELSIVLSYPDSAPVLLERGLDGASVVVTSASCDAGKRSTTVDLLRADQVASTVMLPVTEACTAPSQEAIATAVTRDGVAVLRTSRPAVFADHCSVSYPARIDFVAFGQSTDALAVLGALEALPVALLPGECAGKIAAAGPDVLLTTTTCQPSSCAVTPRLLRFRRDTAAPFAWYAKQMTGSLPDGIDDLRGSRTGRVLTMRFDGEARVFHVAGNDLTPQYTAASEGPVESIAPVRFGEGVLIGTTRGVWVYR